MMIISLDSSVCAKLSLFLFSQPSKKYVSKQIAEDIRKRVFQFIKWLKEAECESEETDDDDGIPVAPSSYHKDAMGDGKSGKFGKSTVKAEVAKVNGNGSGTPPTEEDDDDEVDIDAI